MALNSDLKDDHESLPKYMISEKKREVARLTQHQEVVTFRKIQKTEIRKVLQEQYSGH